MFIIAIALVALISALNFGCSSTDEQSEWRKIYDTVFVAGCSPVEWAYDEPVEDTFARLRDLMKDQNALEIPAKELETARFWLVLLETPVRECDLEYESTLIFSRMNLLGNERRHQLYGNTSVKDLRLDSLIDRKLNLRFEQCASEMIPKLTTRLKKISDDMDNIAESLAAYRENFDGCADCAEKSLKDELIELVEPSHQVHSKRELSRAGAEQLFVDLYWKRIVEPCHRLVELEFNEDDNIDYDFADYLLKWSNRLDDTTKSWLQMRKFCLDRKMFLETSKSTFSAFLEQRDIVIVD